MFPLGELTKPEVREKARELGLTTAEKPESMEICFVPTGNYVDVLEKRLEPGHAALAPGKLVTTTGEVIGEHTGFARYTVGQRKGLPGGRSLPLYVLGSRPETREVIVGSAEELDRREVAIGELNWLASEPPLGAPIQVQIRSRAQAVPATVQALSDGTIQLALDEPQRAVTPGQSAVLFDGPIVLGGGRIV
jgi:tRNA-specific 2-thiouridylase